MNGKERLFAPLKLKHITLPGRLVRSATEYFCSSPDGHVRFPEPEAYRELASQPLGLIITGHTCVSPEGRSNPWQNAAWDDSYLPDLQTVREAASSGGVPVILQIGHGGRKADGNNGGLPVLTPDNMTSENIRDVVKAFGAAAVRAKTAGYNGVMLHAAHMYLLSQFFYPEYNHRTDGYGGCAENRFRIIRECLEEVKMQCGDEYPVFMKINATDRDMTAEYTEETAQILETARRCGLEAAEISGWNSSPRGMPERPYFPDTVRYLRERTEIPMIEVGGIRSTADALLAMDAGADAVSLCRPLLREPAFPSRIRDEENAVSRCTGCCGCFGGLKDGARFRCVLRK